jgi:hypothetical protein
VVTSSGADAVQSSHAPSASGARSSGEEERAGVDLGDRQQLELERGDDAEVAAAAAQRPEQLLVVGVDPALLAVDSDQLDRGHRVAAEPVPAGVPADAATEHVAGDPDGAGRAVPGRQATLGGGWHEVAPDRAGADPGVPRLGVDLDSAQARGPDQEGAVEADQRIGAVTGALHGDPQPPRPGRRDRLGDLRRVVREGDRRRSLVEQEVEGAAVLVVGGGAGAKQLTGHQTSPWLGLVRST